LTGAALFRNVAAASSDTVIGDDYVEEVADVTRPGSSARFVLSSEGDLTSILRLLADAHRPCDGVCAQRRPKHQLPSGLQAIALSLLVVQVKSNDASNA
jgi:hypothetical protein